MFRNLHRLFTLKDGNGVVSTLVYPGLMDKRNDLVYFFGSCPALKVGDGSREVFAITLFLATWKDKPQKYTQLDTAS